jgi:ABC-type lipoprotein export system ATPase subunit
MLRPSSGRVLLGDQDLYGLPPAARNRLRATAIGFVFQLFHLVPYLTVRDNILAGLPSTSDPKLRQRVDGLIEELGLTHRDRHFPGTLSAGERQRTALARALAKNPSVILADEPTGNLDPANATIVFDHLTRFQRQGGTVLVVTHGRDADPHATRIVHLERGELHNAPQTTPARSRS